MTRLRALLDRINDVGAAISRIEAESADRTSLAHRLTVESLERRREVLRDELAEVTKEGFVEVCDYRIIPEDGSSYGVRAVTNALHYFQDMVTLVFDALTDRPKQRASYDPILLEKTGFDFGFAYSGSLSIALVIKNDRELFDTALDQAVAAVFEIIKANNLDQIHDAAEKFGRPTIRKLYDWSKVHKDYGMAAEIKWVRGQETRNSVLAQPQELAEICRLIETEAAPETEPLKAAGTLLSWDTVHRRFIVDFPDPNSEPIKGEISADIDVSQQRTVRVRYEFDLLKHTHIDYSLNRERVVWELKGMRELK